jgi:hypothetical protein
MRPVFLFSSPSATSRAAQPSGPSNRCPCQPRAAAAAMFSARSSVNKDQRPGEPAIRLDHLIDAGSGFVTPMWPETRPGRIHQEIAGTAPCQRSGSRSWSAQRPARPCARSAAQRDRMRCRVAISSQRSCHSGSPAAQSGCGRPRCPIGPGTKCPGRPGRSCRAGRRGEHRAPPVLPDDPRHRTVPAAIRSAHCRCRRSPPRVSRCIPASAPFSRQRT